MPITQNISHGIQPFLTRPTLELLTRFINPLSSNPTKWSNTLKQFVPTYCLSVSKHFSGLAFQGLTFYFIFSYGNNLVGNV